MHEYNFMVRLENAAGEKVAAVKTTSEVLRKQPVTLCDGYEVTLAPPGSLYCNEVLLRDRESVEIDAKHKALLEVAEHFQRAQEDPDRLPGKVCHNCLIFDRAEGRALFTDPTHKYANGSFNQFAEITKAVAANNRARTLTVDVVGYCPIHLKLCAESSVACSSYDPKPWVARVRNWWIRAFR